MLRELALPAGVRAAAPDEAAQRISNVSRAYRVNLTVLALVALFTGAFLVFSILSLSVAQRLPQLALLGVLGLSARERLRAGAGRVGAARRWSAACSAWRSARRSPRWRCACSAATWAAATSPASRRACSSAPPRRSVYGALGVAAAVVGGWLPARTAQRIAPAQALKGLGVRTGAAPRRGLARARCCCSPACCSRCCRRSSGCRWPPTCRSPACCSAASPACRPAWRLLLRCVRAAAHRAARCWRCERARHQRQQRDHRGRRRGGEPGAGGRADGDGGELPRLGARSGSTPCCRPTCTCAPRAGAAPSDTVVRCRRRWSRGARAPARRARASRRSA